jgi:hypothetical protein
MAEPFSPELVLVAGDLRAAAMAALPDRSVEPILAIVARPPSRAATPAGSAIGPRSLVGRVVLYVLWQLMTGAAMGLGVVFAVALAVIALSAVG